MNLFYFPQVTATATTLVLDKEDTRHMTRVLRKRTGDIVHVTDGCGTLFTATIGLITSTRCELDLAFAKAESPKPNKLHIAIAPTKMNDRMEWFLEKATEMGISKITPILCDHSERKIIKLDRFEKIIISAMQQSLQLFKPELTDLITFNEFINCKADGVKVIAHCEDSDKKQLQELLLKNQPATIIIGPEGDFSTSEIKSAIAAGFKPARLGNTRLRTETAGVYTAAMFNGFNSF